MSVTDKHWRSKMGWSLPKAVPVFYFALPTPYYQSSPLDEDATIEYCGDWRLETEHDSGFIITTYYILLYTDIIQNLGMPIL